MRDNEGITTIAEMEKMAQLIHQKQDHNSQLSKEVII
jgi:hypothetical protein